MADNPAVPWVRNPESRRLAAGHCRTLRSAPSQQLGKHAMGKKIAIVGAGAVGGYAGAHMVQAGEDVTFIDPWPEHVEHMRKHGLRVTHAKDVAEFTVPARPAHHGRAAASGSSLSTSPSCARKARHRLGHHAYPAVLGARRLCRLAAELHERGDRRRRCRLG